MDSFSVVILTAGLSCYHKNLYIFGHQDIRENQGGKLCNKNVHFVGTFSVFELVEAEMMNSLSRCVFKPVFNGVSPYVFVTVKPIPEPGTWEICEVEFT